MGAKSKNLKLSRKDARKAKRQEKKHKSAPKPKRSAGPLQEALSKRVETQPSKVLLKNETKEKKSASSSDYSHGGPDSAYIDPMIAAEEKEMERLEKLLGGKQRSKKKKDSKTEKAFAEKLNKEYRMYDGFGDDLGDFLMELDEVGKRNPSDIKMDHGYDSDAPEETFDLSKGHIIEDDEQEPDDLDEKVYSDTEDEEDDDKEDYHEEEGDEEENDKEENDEEENDDGNGSDSSENRSDNSEMEEASDDSGRSSGDVEDEAKGATSAVYQPVAGEDIYGRETSASATSAAGAYVPPARRRALAALDASEDTQALRRQINGLMNRLSEQSRDSVVRSLKELFDNNSVTVCATLLKDLVMTACGSASHVVGTLIPVYASVVAALHHAVGVDVSALIIENLAVRFHESFITSTSSSSKLPNNCALLLVYLYGARVLHHDLIVDIVQFLLQQQDENGSILEKAIEVVVAIIDSSGSQLRSDDPVALREVISMLSQESQQAKTRDEENTRLLYLLSSLTDLKNNKSKREAHPAQAEMKAMRKWLGGVKTSLGLSAPGAAGGKGAPLKVGLRDLLQAESRGRWWRAGASWMGRDMSQGSDGAKPLAASADTAHTTTADAAHTTTAEEHELLKIAVKMRLNTDVRKRIFVVMMSSRDVTDAFERIARLQLKGKQDREIVRVMIECCGQEKAYNDFYAELACLMCSQNRQYKATLQFAFWDLFKSLQEDGRVSDRRAMNLSRMLAHLVSSFHLPLAVLKPLDMGEMPSGLVLFLTTFFLALFTAQVPDETFNSIFDRVSTTKDFAAVKGVVLYFLNKHFVGVPEGFSAEQTKAIMKRKKKAIRALEAMEVLEYAHDM